MPFSSFLFQLAALSVDQPSIERERSGSWLNAVAQGVPAEVWRNFQRDTFDVCMRYMPPPPPPMRPQVPVQTVVQAPVQTILHPQVLPQYQTQFPTTFMSMLGSPGQQQGQAYVVYSKCDLSYLNRKTFP